ncbi:hypothetical protein PSHT_12373 [Puccinia striiformis]|uniref:Uncharacterized protein n=1 Tax=Puccinia striiformis TaxID=27350 RepID=A0A2S4UX08_9BASI|nr:hypothetical protein PSHT_12373 [Puccinia striiformis]
MDGHNRIVYKYCHPSFQFFLLITTQHNPTHPSRVITRNNLKTIEPKMNSNNQRSRGGVSNDMADSSMNSTKDMMSGMDSGGGGKMDDNFGNNDRQNHGDNQGLMGKMASMVGVGNNNNDSNNNDRSGQNPSSKMMGGVGGGGGQQDFNRQRNNNQDQQPSMGDKVKGTYQQAKGKVMNDPHTARKGDMRKDQAGGDSNDIMGGAGI